MKAIKTAILTGIIATAITACSENGQKSFTSYKEYPKKGLLSVPEPTPQDEPKSRYGNPPTYKVFGKKYSVLESSANYNEEGLASWYGPKFHGKRTSSGEPYNMFAMTAAHKSLPLPTYVKVRNKQNGKEIIVKVNDRGPFKDGRIIDLSYVAAYQLGVVEKGVVPVEVTALPVNRTQAANN